MRLKVAIVHEWFAAYAGSERVVEQMLHVFPGADVFGVADFLPQNERAFLGGRPVRTSFVQRLPLARRAFRLYLPLMPLAIEQLDVRGYDLVLSSNHAVAKGVITGPDQLHISYVHSPIRYAWDLQHQYLEESQLHRGLRSWMARAMLHYLRLWDVRTASGVDLFIANSEYIGRRIRKAYGRASMVIYPPVDVQAFTLRLAKDDFYLAASRMVPYKKMPLIVEAFARTPHRKLIVVGAGPDYPRCQRLATPNIEFVGYQPFHALRDYMQRARALVFAAEEDFGITVVEAQACGTPVIAYGKGGVLESVRGLGESAAPTGVFFSAQNADAVVSAVERFERERAAISPLECRRNAERFSVERFRAELKRCVEDQLGSGQESHRYPSRSKIVAVAGYG
jgi:glycosyltransferase involved in cell wall biosynthesis